MESFSDGDLLRRLAAGDEEPKPPEGAALKLAEAVHEGPAAEESGTWLQESLNEETGYADTHPCLADGLRTLGYLAKHNVAPGEAPPLPPLPAPGGPTAAQHFLSARAAELGRRLDAEWKKAVTCGHGRRSAGR